MSQENIKKSSTKKEERAIQVLMGLVELYLQTGEPIGSNTLKEHSFPHLSSATLRNYFVQLEEIGYLQQPHASGGRVPTHKALRRYAESHLSDRETPSDAEEALKELIQVESRNVAAYLQQAAEKLSELTQCAVFLSSVRFDHDLVSEIRLVNIDQERVLCVIITDFGQILTEILSSKHKLSSFSLKRIESHFNWWIKGGSKPENISREEEEVAQKFYNEVMVRYFVRYSNFSDEDVFRTGFSRLLHYPEFNDPIVLASALSLFENASHMRQLLSDCVSGGNLRYWIGDDLALYTSSPQSCSVLAIPYRIGPTIAGAVGILGPCRMSYRNFFGTLRFFSESISNSLTKSLYRFKISFRQPHSKTPYIQQQERAIVDQTSQKLLEIKD
ncbi:MAG: heat-inducible transcriptional repressor HrcA [Chlamydiales bacterium]